MHVSAMDQQKVTSKASYPGITKVHYRKKSPVDVLEKDLPMLTVN